MKKSNVIHSILLFVAVMMLSGCLYPYWEDEGSGRRGGGHRGGGYGEDSRREGGHREGGTRR